MFPVSGAPFSPGESGTHPTPLPSSTRVILMRERWPQSPPTFSSGAKYSRNLTRIGFKLWTHGAYTPQQPQQRGLGNLSLSPVPGLGVLGSLQRSPLALNSDNCVNFTRFVTQVLMTSVSWQGRQTSCSHLISCASSAFC